MGSLIVLALLPVLVVGLLLRLPGQRRFAPYALLLLGIAQYCLTHRSQGAELVVASLVLCAGFMWCLERHGY